MQTVEQVIQSVQQYLPNLLAAVGILVVGAIVALIIAGIVRAALRRTTVDNRFAEWVVGDAAEKPLKVESTIARIVFAVLMLFVLVAMFESLGLTLLTQPLNELLNEVVVYLPRLLGAAMLVVLAWGVATALRTLITRGLGKTKLDERVSEEMLGSEQEPVSMSKTLGNVVYWLVFLLFFPAVLGTLGLQGLLQPVQGMVNEVLNYVPNIATAALILIAGWLVARILQRIVRDLLEAGGTDRLSSQVGMDRALGKYKLSRVIGLVVYALIFVPVIIAALNALAIDAVTGPASNMLDTMLAAVPAFFAAGLLIGVSYIVARVVGGLVTSLLAGVGFDRLLERLGFGGSEATEQRTPSIIVGYIVVVAIMLFASIEALSLLAFDSLSDLLLQLAFFGANALVGVVVFGIGMYLANLAAAAIQTSRARQARTLAIAARGAILLLAGAMALQQIGVAQGIITLAFGLLLGALAVSAAIAFGLGGRELASQQLHEWRQNLKENGLTKSTKKNQSQYSRAGSA